MNTQELAIKEILKERKYQDTKHGTIEEHPHTLPEWVLIMEKELIEAKEAYFKDAWGVGMLKEIIQVAAVGLAALEQHLPEFYEWKQSESEE